MVWYVTPWDEPLDEAKPDPEHRAGKPDVVRLAARIRRFHRGFGPRRDAPLSPAVEALLRDLGV